MRLEYIPMWDVPIHWESVAPHLAKALERQCAMTLESVREDCRRGKFFLWHVPGVAALVTEIQVFPAERVCMVVLCGGERMEEWIAEVDATLLRHARAYGCAAIMVVGRIGWSRLLPQYEAGDVVMRRAL